MEAARFDKYLIYNNGTVFSLISNRKLIPRLHNGSLTVKINGKHMQVKRLVAEKFLPNPNDYNVIRCIDGDQSNVALENLEWAKGPLRGRPVEIDGVLYKSIKEAAAATGTSYNKLKEVFK